MEKTTNALAEMDKLPVRKAVNQNVLPAMMIMLMSLVYNMADKVFIRMTGNDYMVAAVTMALPLFLIFSSLGNIFGTGGVALVSRYLGEGNTKDGRNVETFCFWASLGTGIVIMLFLLVFRSSLVRLLGASNPDTIRFTEDYLLYVAICCPFSIAAQTISNLMRADGKPTLSMVGMVLGNVVNIIVDPILILGFGLGTAGAAGATLIGQASAFFFYLICILRKKSDIAIDPHQLTMDKEMIGKILSIGTPAAIGSIFQSICNVFSNSQMAVYGDIAVASLGAMQNIINIICILAIGIGMGIQPLLGYQIGTGNRKRFDDILKYSIALIIGICAVLTILCYLFTTPVIGAFVSSSEGISLGVSFARIALLSAWAYALFNVISYVLPAMGESKTTLIVSMSRNCYIFLPFLFLLGHLAGMYGIIWAYVASDLICLALSAAIMMRAIRKAFEK